MENVITAKQIHADFYSAEERLFVEAIGLTKGTLVSITKAERLRKIGFGKAKPIKDAEEYHRKRGVSEQLISTIEYFRTYYPQYKFITESEVESLCKKYGLLLGEAANFTADMPEKNLQDIERFKLRKEDFTDKKLSWFDGVMANRWLIDESPSFVSSRRRSGNSMLDSDALYAQYLGLALQTPTRYVAATDPYAKETKKDNVEKEQPAFKICAPKEDFDTRGYEVVDGHKLVYDPIVLQPVFKNGISGFLIITAWGDEASDELVVNETNN